MTVARFIKAWDRFFFAPVSPYPLILFRVCFGMIVFFHAFYTFPNVELWLGSNGMMPVQSALALSTGWKYLLIRLFELTGISPKTYSVIYGLAGLALSFGIYARISAFIIYICFAYLFARMPGMTFATDELIWLYSMIFMFAPQPEPIFSKRKSKTQTIPYWPIRLIQIHLSWIYVLSVWGKISGKGWVDGTAIYYVMQYEFIRRFDPAFMDSFLQKFSEILTWGVVITESTAATLLWFARTRPYAMAAVALLHLSIEFSLLTPLLQWLMLASLIVFIDGRALEKIISHSVHRLGARYFFKPRRNS